MGKKERIPLNIHSICLKLASREKFDHYVFLTLRLTLNALVVVAVVVVVVVALSLILECCYCS